MAPLEVLHASSPFGFRVSPLTGTTGDFHLGQDYAAACGTRVYAADSGVVRAAGWHPWGGGNRVEIDHGNGLITTYNHLEAIAVKTGDSVDVGQVIARVGTTGWSTGCYLHFETILRGKQHRPARLYSHSHQTR
ncbi:MAG TPA: peptidase M23, partial [Arthrobacter bacterium]|nr:peptidase M23 [Arthrobacter sp.]